MPIARFQMPDGRIARFEVPEGTTPEQATALIEKQVASMKPKDKHVLRDTVRSALQGVTMGFADEAGAGIAAAAAKLSGADEPIGDIYRGMKAGLSEEQKQFSKDHRLLSTGAEIAGAMIPAALTMGASTAPLTLAQTAKTGATVGGLQGAAYGAGTAETGNDISESLSSTASGALKGGAIGTLAGATIPVAVVGGGRIAKGILSNIANSIGSGSEKKAVEIIRKVARESGISAEDAAEQLNNLGPKATLADVDENFLIKAKNSVNQYGSQKQAFRQLVTERQLGEHGDVLNVLSKQVGGFTGDDVYTALQQTGIERSKAASPLYEKAFAAEIPSGVLDNPKLKHNEIIQKALRDGEKYAKSDPDRLVTLAADGSIENIQRPLTPMERWHYAKKSLWAKEQKLRRAGDKELANNIAKNRMLVDDVLNSNNDYAEARKIWSSSEDAVEAAKVGQDFFKMSPHEFKQAIAGMNEHDLQMAKMGVMNAATDKAGATKDARSIAGMLTGDENARQKVKALFGGEKELNELVKNAKKWETFRKTKNVLTSGSPTAELLTTGAEDAAAELISNPQGTITKKMIEAFKGSRMSPETAQAVGKIMMRQGWTKEEVVKLIGKPEKSLSGITSRVSPALPIVGGAKLNEMMRQ